MSTEPKPVYIVDGARTPFLKAQGVPGVFSASDLAVGCLRSLLIRQPFDCKEVGEIVSGCVSPEPTELNIARVIALRLRCGNQAQGYTVQRNCGSAMQAIDNAMLDIQSGRHDLVLAGGTECMSRSPILYSPEMATWLAEFKFAKSFGKRLQALMKFRPRFLAPTIGLLQGLTDHTVNMSMGMTAEKLAYLFRITRQEMDEFAQRSQARARLAQSLGHLSEIAPIYDYEGNRYDQDTGVRDSSLEKLAKLPAAFDKPFGLVTAGNSSQVTDGAAFVLLASEAMVKRYSLPVLGKIIHTRWSAIDPTIMGLGPVHAIASVFRDTGLSAKDIDYWEINEAFAAQVLACLRAMEDTDFCRDHLGLEKAIGKIDQDKLNVDGGAIAMGHPVGASGARIVLHLLHVLARYNARLGMAAICIGGGQGGAMILERCEVRT